MILIIGGSHQGKLQYACKQFNRNTEDFIDGAVCTLEALYTCKGVNRFHEFIKKNIKMDETVIRQLHTALVQKNPDMIIITNELGYGIVPMDPFERFYREETGRFCCKLAEQASQVHRVVCGIGMVMKEERGSAKP